MDFIFSKLYLNENNLKAQIYRLGNITNRFSDGKFQINYNENATIIPFPNVFFVAFSAKQYSQVDKSTFSMCNVLYLIIDQHQVLGSLIGT